MFLDRSDAGRRLAQALRHYKGKPVVVYALPRGGVVLGAEIARALGAPLDLIVVRKIGHPLSPEYAIGAVTDEGEILTNPAEVSSLDPEWLSSAAAEELREARRRRAVFLRGHVPVDVRNKVAIVVDDGIATGLTLEAAIRQLRKRGPERVVVAAPVAAADTVHRLRSEVDELVVLEVPRGGFGGIGAYYQDFHQVSDDEVVALMGNSDLGIRIAESDEGD